LVKLDNINLSFANKQIFDNLSISVLKNEKICLSGPSGKGKTSLLKMLPGLVVPDSGEITIDGEQLNTGTVGNIRKKLSWVPQNINLPADNCRELSELLGLISNKEGIISNLYSIGLDDSYYKKDFHDISGGEKQRIIISVVLTIDKPILLLDEPTSALDEKSIEKLAGLISNQKDKTVISASHNKLWMEMSERTISL